MQKLIIHILIVLSFFNWSFKSYAQVLKDYNDISIFFGDKEKTSRSVESFTKTKGKELLCVQNKLSVFQMFSKNNSKYTFDLIKDYSLPKSKPIQFYGEGEKTNLIDYSPIGNQILGLSYRTTFLDQNPALFYHFINPVQNGRTNHGFPLSGFNSMRNLIDLSRLSVVSSMNEDFAAVLYIPKTKPEEYTSLKYTIIKNDYSISNENEFLYPYPSLAYKPLEYFLVDETNQIFISGHYIKNKTENISNNIKAYFKHISITKITNNELTFEKIENSGKYFTEIKAIENEEDITISCLYSSYIDGQIEGTYIAIINKEGKLKNSYFTPFPKELIRPLKVFKDDFFTNQVRSRKDYSTFNILDFHEMEDGYILSAEFNAIEYRYGGTDVPGATNVIDTYFWSSDIIICKIDKSGQLIWIEIIPKIQRSINDGGYYLSTASYFGEQHIHLFFNDNLSNYNEEGVYNKTGDTPLPTQFSNSKNTIAHVSIDINNGLIKRKSTIGKEEMDIIFVSKLAVAFKSTKKLMIYGRSGNKHRVGSISFNE